MAENRIDRDLTTREKGVGKGVGSVQKLYLRQIQKTAMCIVDTNLYARTS